LRARQAIQHRGITLNTAHSGLLLGVPRCLAIVWSSAMVSCPGSRQGIDCLRRPWRDGKQSVGPPAGRAARRCRCCAPIESSGGERPAGQGLQQARTNPSLRTTVRKKNRLPRGHSFPNQLKRRSSLFSCRRGALGRLQLDCRSPRGVHQRAQQIVEFQIASRGSPLRPSFASRRRSPTISRSLSVPRTVSQ